MPTTRREFVHLSILTGAAAAVAAGDRQRPISPVRRKLEILVLGGTGLIGPPLVRYALDRGHQVTLFNRGKTNADLFPDLERLVGDRNDDLTAIASAVAGGRRWDAVIDNTASIPRWVTSSAGALKNAADLYLYTSSISAYASMAIAGQDEAAAVASLSAEEEAKVKTPGDITGVNYGGLKARCEQEAERAFPGRAIIVRPGLIVGPGDYTDRFTYWPVRIHRGGEVMAPGNPSDPVQFIDARDLGEWMVRLVEDRAIGVYNGTGPASRMSIAEMLYGIRATTGTEISFTWVDAEFLAKHEIQPWSQMTVWVPGESEFAGISQVSIDAAKRSGLTFRPLAVTAADTVEWWNALPEERRAAPKAGLDANKEKEVLAAWKTAQSK